jgi:hypothetical protein
MNDASASGYKSLLASLVQRFRADVSGGSPRDAGPVPFVIGLIHAGLPAEEFPCIGTVRQAQSVVAESLPRCATVDSSAFSLREDGIHFDTAGVMALGRAFAAALRRFR